MANELKYLVIHCTATPEGREVTSAEIRRWHTSPEPVGRGWKQVGYTDMFHINGGVERMCANNEDGIVDNWEITNGAAGHNTVSRHVVYVGGMSKGASNGANNGTCSIAKDTRTALQKEAMKRYVRAMMIKFTNIKVVGHRDLDNGKACPSFDVGQWLKTIQ